MNIRLLVLLFAGTGLCAIPGSAGEVTFSESIAPIVFQKCASCHRPGEAGPFPLTDYASVRRRARTIQRVVAAGYMPPWFPEDGWGEFRGDFSLTDEETDLIHRWVESGAPRGDPGRTPPLPDFPEGWHLGEPDLVVEMDEAFEIHAEGPDIYRYFVLPLNLSRDRWVKAVEVRPSQRAVVHHVLFYLDDTGKARKLASKDRKPGFNGKGFKPTGSLGGWAVGGTPYELSPGYARPLPKDADLVLQTHFHPTGKVEREKTRIGLFFSEQAPEKPLVEFQVPPGFGSRTGLNVAPGDRDFVLRDHLVVPEDLDLVSVWGHAHQICRSMQALAILPDGSRRKLFRIGDWQFNWQGQYAYAQPVRLPKDTRIEVEIRYDNSSENPSNPHHPPRRIFWGEQSSDEMGSLIFQCVAADRKRHGALVKGLAAERKKSRKRFAEAVRVTNRQRLVLGLDANGDDRISRGEIEREHRDAFSRLDGDRNGAFLDELLKKKSS